MNQDLATIEPIEETIDRLIDRLRQNRGDLTIHATDLSGWSLGARFYPLMYLLARTCGARDWITGIELSQHLLGRLNSLQIHHVFPKALLYEHGYERSEVNAIANFAFLTQESNLAISDKPPHEYLAEIAERDLNLLESQWIPLEPELWRVDRYRDFLEARRELLAKAANDLLTRLNGSEVEGGVMEDLPKVETERPSVEHIPGGIVDDQEEEEILRLVSWIEEQDLPEPELMYELADRNTNETVAVLDVAWPKGLQTGLSSPVCLLLAEPDDVARAANNAGFRYFTDMPSFKEYVRREIPAEVG